LFLRVFQHKVDFRQFLNFCSSHDCAARNFELKEASMPKRIPNTQTGSLTDNQHGTNDMLIGGDIAANVLYGDAFSMFDNARGGNDTLIGGANTSNELFGDAFAMYDEAYGGNDTLIGGANAINDLFGDAFDMRDDARGGNDTLVGGDHADNDLFGDAVNMRDDARGGNDTLIGGALAFINNFFGDALTMYDKAHGGNDTLIGGEGSVNWLRGDAQDMRDDAHGGNDTLIGVDDSLNNLFGDAIDMRDNARGGNDTLISGNGTDVMWGDAQIINGVPASPTAATGTVETGADTYVFAPGNGSDYIYDFRQSDHDKIDLSAYGFHSIADLMVLGTGPDTYIALDATNSLTLVGIPDINVLHESDFIFA
jgi:Ca2+-binding RTX toxin-like protein